MGNSESFGNLMKGANDKDNKKKDQKKLDE